MKRRIRHATEARHSAGMDFHGFKSLSVGMALCVCLGPLVWAATVHVALTGSNTEPYDTWANAATDIQTAVSYATSGDTVLITNGEYHLTGRITIDYHDKYLTVKGLNGASNTIVVGTGANGCFYLYNTIGGTPSVLDGLTITNGCTGLGAGVEVLYAGVIQNCRIVGNQSTGATAFEGGGGVYMSKGGIVSNCLISGNTAYNNGGGVYILAAGCVQTGRVINCVVEGNTAYQGGGVYCAQGGFVIGSLVNNNTGGNGGGIYCKLAGFVQNCTITKNVANTGGGVYAEDSSSEGNVLVTCSIISNNTSAVYGGGAYLFAYFFPNGLVVRNCLIVQNVVTQQVSCGGGVYLKQGGVVESSTVCDNTSADQGGGLHFYFGGKMLNSIIYSNQAASGLNYYRQYGGTSEYCCTTPLPAGVSNITANPLLDSTWRLTASSPCINTGTNLNWMLTATDLDGNPRIATTIVDRGAYEYAEGKGPPVVNITNEDTIVTRDVASFDIGGTCNSHVKGILAWTNELTGSNGTCAATSSWTITGIALEAGANDISVTGTNLLETVGSDRVTFFRQGAGTGSPFVDITNEDATVSYDVETSGIQVTNNMEVVGVLVWTNERTGQDGSRLAGYPWNIDGISLSVGTNRITVTGTNSLGASTNDSVTMTRLGIGSGLPFVNITNEDQTVGVGADTCSIGGTNNAHVVGMMRWTNSATGANAQFAASATWTINGIALEVGLNVITVTGTNSLGLSTNDQVTITRPPMVSYVSPAGSHAYPYASWATAATTIQAAVDAAVEGTVVLVADGTYNTGGAPTPGFALSNRVAITKAITVRSVNGPASALIVGEGPNGNSAMRCAYLVYGAQLTGFALTNGHTMTVGDSYCDQSGGGVFMNCGGTLSNCVIRGNEASLYGGGVLCYWFGTVQSCILQGNSVPWYGGGVYCYHGGFLENCLISQNSANQIGGGVECDSGGALNNCSIVGNSASGYGGGVDGWGGGWLGNCIIYSNTAPSFANWSGYGFTLYYCCTTPTSGLPAATACIDSNPQFVNMSTGNYHLSQGSPCIDTGITNGAPRWDLDGVSRPLDGDANGVAGTDMGAYEFVHSLADTDRDGMSDSDELWAGTDPLSSASALRLQSTRLSAGNGRVLSWSSVSGRQYIVWLSTNLLVGFDHVAKTNVLAISPLNTQTDTTAVGIGPWFYRVQVE